MLKNKLIAHNGSVQNIREIPQNIKDLYKTVWELSQKTLIDMAADRGAYIDQSQSLNIHMQDVNYGKLTSMHFHAWSKGLKTGMYYLRTKPATDAIKFTVDAEALKLEVEADRKLKQREDQRLHTSASASSTSDLERKSASSDEKQQSPLDLQRPAGLQLQSSYTTDSPLSSPLPTPLQHPAPSSSCDEDKRVSKSEPVSQTVREASSVMAELSVAPLVSGQAFDMACLEQMQPPIETQDTQAEARVQKWLDEAERRVAERQRQQEAMMCSLTNKDACDSCGS